MLVLPGMLVEMKKENHIIGGKRPWRGWRRETRRVMANYILRPFYKRVGRMFMVTRNGISMVLSSKSRIDLQLLTRQHYEAGLISHALEVIRQNDCDVFIDVGANLGIYTLSVAKHTSIREIYAFEPVRRTYYQLCANIFVNDISDRVKAVNIGLSNSARQVVIHKDPKSSAPSRIDKTSDDYTDTELIRLCKANEELALAGRRIFIKIDVEGHECEALEGMQTLLTTNICYLQVEAWDEARLTRVSEILSNTGYAPVGGLGKVYFFAGPTN